MPRINTIVTGDNVSNNSFTLASGETKTVTVDLTTNYPEEIKYKMFYTSETDASLNVSSNETFDTGIVEGTMTNSKTFTLTIKNEGNESVTLNLGTNGGLKQYPVNLGNTQNPILLKVNVLKNLNGITEWTNIRANITSVEFHTDNQAPSNPITSFDATDSTSLNPVTVYTLDDGLGQGTYKAIIVSNDVIYGPSDCTRMFAVMGKLTTFNSTNFIVDRVNSMENMFRQDEKLIDISTLANWNTSNVTSMKLLFLDTLELADLSALENWNTSNVTTLYGLFQVNSSTYNAGKRRVLSNIDALANWDTSSVTDMTQMFQNCDKITNVDTLRNWDVSKVTTMKLMFINCLALINVDGLVNWNTSNVTDMSKMFFNNSSLSNMDALANWNVSNVKTMEFMFSMTAGMSKTGNPIIDYSPLANWNVSNVTSMYCMFQNNNIKSYKAFSKWNVGKVQNFNEMFNQTSASTVTTLEGLENWDVSSATDMSYMFYDNVSLQDASAINNWNIKSSISFNEMFENTPVHPTFTKVAGTWDSNGTFTPSS